MNYFQGLIYQYLLPIGFGIIAQADAYAAEIGLSLAYFEQQAVQQLPLVEA